MCRFFREERSFNKRVHALWLGMLEVGGQLGISEIAISGLRRVAGSIVWNFNPKNFRRRLKNKSIRMGQLFFGRWGFTLGAAVSQSEVIRLARLIKPVPYSSALIRVGGPKDGGYLVPDDLEGVVSCFSPGVATTASFELDLAGLGINSYLADFSVDGPPFQNPMFDFEKKFIGVESDDTMYVRLDDWVQSKHRVAGDLILQMDIEGAEWPILADVSQETLEKFRIIVIELHDLDQMMTSVSGSRVVESVFRKLRSRFWTVHLHPNNCCPPTRYQGLDIPPVMEVTLLRKDRLKGLKTGDQVQIPHPLDAKNVQAYKNVDLAAYWYANQI